jgi:malate synthase
MKNTQTDAVPGVEILATRDQAFSEILTPDALKFVADLERRFGPRRLELLAARAK